MLPRRTFLTALILLLAPLPSSAFAADTSPRIYPKVEMYTTTWCPYCIQAKAFFDQRDIPYTFYDIEKSREAAVKKQRLAPGAGVPVVVIGDAVIRGYSKKAFLTALELDE